jgi:hypothetical protein
LRWRIRTAADVEVGLTPRAKMAAGKDLPTKVLMAIPREPMALRGSVVGVGRAWTKNLNVHSRVVAKVTREPSICKV